MCDFTVCVLLYGDYPELARRVLGSLCRPEHASQFQLRVAANQISPATEAVVDEYRSWISQLIQSPTNAYKYPMMRRLFYDVPLTTPYMMWFDDDSFVHDAQPYFFNAVRHAMTQADVLGALYQIRMKTGQADWIKQQRWYANKPARTYMTFVTGGWWVTRTTILQQWDWPSPELQHNGGDSMFGELCRQQGYRLVRFTQGVAINADQAGRLCAAKRRGAWTEWPGVKYGRRTV